MAPLKASYGLCSAHNMKRQVVEGKNLRHGAVIESTSPALAHAIGSLEMRSKTCYLQAKHPWSDVHYVAPYQVAYGGGAAICGPYDPFSGVSGCDVETAAYV